MSRFALSVKLRPTLLMRAALVLAFAQLSAKAAPPPPNFAPSDYGWIVESPDFGPPPNGPGPIVNDPKNGYDLNRVFDVHHPPGGEANTFRLADLSNPILQPWTREALRKVNQRIIDGRPGYTLKVRCWPMSVPAFLLYNVTPIYFIQTPSKVWITAREDHMVRHVYMNVPHTAHPTPSWYGESIGHYEGDALVVDTIGITTKSVVDNFRTPHTDKLHVVERFHIIEGGKTLEVDLTVEDPGAFTMPWHAVQRFRNGAPERRDFGENVCAENTNLFGEADPVPEDDKPAF